MAAVEKGHAKSIAGDVNVLHFNADSMPSIALIMFCAHLKHLVPIWDCRKVPLEFPNKLPPSHCPRWPGMHVPRGAVCLVSYTVNTWVAGSAKGKDAKEGFQEPSIPSIPSISMNLMWVGVLDVEPVAVSYENDN